MSATLVASMLTTTYGSVALAAPAPISCKVVLSETETATAPTTAPKSERKPITEKISSVIDRAYQLRIKTYLAVAQRYQKWRGRDYAWDDAKYEAYYNEVKTLAAGNFLDFDKYQTPEALLAVLNVSAERSRTKYKVFTGDFSFEMMMRNASDLQRHQILTTLHELIESSTHGYDSWRTEDVMAKLYLFSKDPMNAADLLKLKVSEREAIEELAERHIEVQLLRGDIGKFITEIGLSRPEDDVRDTFNKLRTDVKIYQQAIIYSGMNLIFPLGLSLMAKQLLLGAGTALSAGQTFLMYAPFPSVLTSRTDLPTKVEEQAKTETMAELYDDMPVKNKVRVAIEVNVRTVQWIGARIIMAAGLFMVVTMMWQHFRPELRVKHPEIVNVAEFPGVVFSRIVTLVKSGKGPKAQRQDLDTQIYKKWHDQWVTNNPDIDKTPAAAQERQIIAKARESQLRDVLKGVDSLADLGMDISVDKEQAKKDLGLVSVDENPDGTSADADDAGYRPIPQ